MFDYYSSTTIQSNTTTKDKILVPNDDGTRTIGVIKNHTFIKSNFNSSKHVCHKYKAIGIDLGAFNNYIKPNTQLIRCPDKSNCTTFSIPTGDFESNAFIDDLGCGNQIFCPLKFWLTQKDDCHQLSLWGGVLNG
jgi:hypothetical protein